MTADQVLQRLREIRYQPPLLNIRAIAAQAGISHPTLYRAIRKGRLPERHRAVIERVLLHGSDMAVSEAPLPALRKPGAGPSGE